MKKSKLLVLGLIALMLVGGMALVSCGPSCDNNGYCKIGFYFGRGISADSCGDSGCSVNKVFAEKGATNEALEANPKCNC
jgi:hypothetical protein